MIKVYLDNNCWDFLFFHQIELAMELPADQFEIWLARETEMEILPLQWKNSELYLFKRCAQNAISARIESWVSMSPVS